MRYVGPLVCALVAVAILFRRRELASLQAHVLGGSVLPGCVIAEAVALFAIAVALYFLG